MSEKREDNPYLGSYQNVVWYVCVCSGSEEVENLKMLRHTDGRVDRRPTQPSETPEFTHVFVVNFMLLWH
jgi:hypothetical protein